MSYFDNTNNEEHQEFELMEPFDIDNGELDGIDLRTVFCLGYECCQLHELLDTGRAFRKTVHIESIKRVTNMCQRRGREFSIDTDIGSEWFSLSVEAM